MKHFYNLFFFILSTTYIFSQNEADHWYFGDKAGIDFGTGSPVALFDGQLDTLEGCTSISDGFGNLLFYSDGITVWNRAHVVMPNGTGLTGDSSSSQSGIIVPNPSNSDQYYLFTVDAGGGNLSYSIVDMTLDSGLGDVVVASKNINLIPTAAEKIAAIDDGNGGYWVIGFASTSGFGTPYNTFHAFNVTNAGVSTPVLSTFSICQTSDARGYLKISPDGSRIVICNQNQQNVCLYDFDVATGTLSNESSLAVFDTPYGAEFSPSSEKLYVGTGTISTSTTFLRQFDLLSSNVQASMTTIHTEVIDRGALQLAKDGKIYYARSDRTFLGVINDPENAGTACNYVNNQVSLGSRQCKQGLPPFIQSFFIADVPPQIACLGDPINFTLAGTGSVQSVLWDFGDGNSSTDLSPDHTYTAVGVYNVTASVVFTNNSTDTVISTAEVFENPIANQPVNFIICDDPSSNDGFAAFDLTTKIPEVLGTQLATDFTVTFHLTQADADSNQSALNSPYTNTSNNQTIFARIENANNANCFTTTSFDLIVSNTPTANTVANIIECDDSSNDDLTILNFSAFDSQVLNGQSASEYDITYHLSQTDADSNIGGLTDGYQNISNPQTFYVRIENNQNTDCFETTSFTLTIDTFFTANQPTDFILCDDVSNNGTESFDLTSKIPELLGTQSATEASITFYENQTDADLAQNDISSPYTNTSNNQTIFVRIENVNNASCYDTTSFNLIVNDSPTANTVANIVECDDPSNDELTTIIFSDLNMQVHNGQNPSVYDITYHLTQSDADSDIGALADGYQNISNPQTFFVRIENNQNTSCFDTTSFSLSIDTYFPIGQPSDMILCDDISNDGEEVFDLSTQIPDVINGQIGNFDVTFYASFDNADSAMNELPLSFTNVLNNQEIFVRLQEVGSVCYEITSFRLIVLFQPEAHDLADVSLCDFQNDQVEPMNFNNYDATILANQDPSLVSITYHLSQADADINNNPLPDNFQNTSNPQEFFVRIENAQNPICFDTTSFTVTIDRSYIAVQPDNLYLCDDTSNDGVETFDLLETRNEIANWLATGNNVTYHLTQSDADSNTNALSTNYSNESNPQTIFARIENDVNPDCYDTTSFLIEVLETPIIIEQETYYLCTGEDLILTAEAGFDQYIWSTGETTRSITVTEAGTFTVEIIEDYQTNGQVTSCSNIKTITVIESDEAVIENIVTTDWTATDNTIGITVSGLGLYEYSLDGVTYQDEPLFTGLETGEFNVYVRDIYGCGVVTQTVYLLSYPRFFTPNNDSQNDFWQIIASETEPDLEILILDRYGKLLTTLNPNSVGWDGTYNGRNMPATDYWFIVKRPSNGRTYYGHFALVR